MPNYELKSPTLVTELQRLADALAPIPPCERGDDVVTGPGGTRPVHNALFVVASTLPPRHRVQGITAKYEEAKAMLAVDPDDPLMPWDQDDRESRRIYLVEWPDIPAGLVRTDDRQYLFTPRYGSGEIIDPCIHLVGSEPCCPMYAYDATTAYSSAKMDDVQDMYLIVNADRWYAFPVSKRTDAIFLTAGSKEKFIAPHYMIRHGGYFAGGYRSHTTRPQVLIFTGASLHELAEKIGK